MTPYGAVVHGIYDRKTGFNIPSDLPCIPGMIETHRFPPDIPLHFIVERTKSRSNLMYMTGKSDTGHHL
jgi:hypothetical protein